MIVVSHGTVIHQSVAPVISKGWLHLAVNAWTTVNRDNIWKPGPVKVSSVREAEFITQNIRLFVSSVLPRLICPH